MLSSVNIYFFVTMDQALNTNDLGTGAARNVCWGGGGVYYINILNVVNPPHF